MVKLAPFGLAVAVVSSTLVLVGLGAAVTSNRELASVRAVLPFFAVLVSILTLGLGATLWRSYRGLGIALVASVLLLGVPMGESSGLRAAHAVLAQCFFGLSWAAMLVTSRRWQEGPWIVQDGGVPSLRSLSVFVAGVTLVQVMLGAGFRHGAMSVVPHVVGAIVTTVLVLVLATFTITQFPKHRVLVGSAWHLIGTVTLQIGLGVVAFVGRLNHPEGVDPSSGLMASTVAHVVVGALTLASTFALALQVRYHVRPRAAFESGLPVAS